MLFEECTLPVDISFALTNADADVVSGTEFEKQIIYVGKFGHYDAKTGKPKQEYPVTAADLYHWADSIKLQRSRGIKIDLPIGHTEDAEKSRGEVTDGYVKTDAKGRLSLYVKGKFNSADDAKLLKNSQVSVHSPPEWADGTGNTYRYPVRHVALTNNPVVPDTERFAITASLTEKPKAMSKHTLRSIATGLGLTIADGVDDDAIGDSILVAGLVPKSKAEAAAPAKTEAVSFSLTDPRDKRLCDLTVRDRVNNVDALVISGQITPAVSKFCKEKFCTEAAVSLSLSGTEDGFDNLLAGYKLLPTSGLTKQKTGAQVVNLENSSATTSEESTLATRLRAKAKKNA